MEQVKQTGGLDTAAENLFRNDMNEEKIAEDAVLTARMAYSAGFRRGVQRAGKSYMVDGFCVEAEIEKEIEAAEKREKSGDMMIAIAAGAQKAVLQRLLAYVEGLMDGGE